MKLPFATFSRFNPTHYPLNLTRLPRAQRRIGEILLDGNRLGPRKTLRSWALDFLKAPSAIIAPWDHIESVQFTKQEFPAGVDRMNPSATVVPADEEWLLEAAAAFRSIGYKAKALPGLSDMGVPFDHQTGVIPNDTRGRILSPSQDPAKAPAGHVHGLYCAGWVKNGPKGVIANTMTDAFWCADTITQDWLANAPFLNTTAGEETSTGLGWDGIKEHVLQKGVRPISWADWQRIDNAERERGKSRNKTREKFTSVDAMLKALDA